MKYLYETHFHTSETSPCGEVAALDGIRMYKQSGYSGVIVTDHLYTSLMTRDGRETWDEMVDYHMRGYLKAAELADEDFTVLYGAEIRLTRQSNNDYLVYGLTEKLMRETPFICETESIKQFYGFCQEHGLLVFQAHPFRNDMTVTPPGLTDGIEEYNGHECHDSRNIIAKLWAKRYSLPGIGGSDFHYECDRAHGGIITDTKISTNEDLLRILRNNEFSVYRYPQAKD